MAFKPWNVNLIFLNARSVVIYYHLRDETVAKSFETECANNLRQHCEVKR